MPQSISLTLPVSQAVYRVKRLLFEPFDFGKWFVIGFCAWLAELGRGGVGAGLKFKGGNPAAIAAGLPPLNLRPAPTPPRPNSASHAQNPITNHLPKSKGSNRSRFTR